MVYDWDNKEDLCYRMYIEEKKSLEDIMEYMKEHHKFNPSKRAFQTQFKRWEFPSKQNPAHKNEELVQRVKELWEKNTSQREMLRILNEEHGFDIKERELMRVRAKNRWLLRVPNGMKTRKTHNSEQEVMEQLQQALFDDEQQNGGQSIDMGLADSAIPRSDSPDLSPEVIAKRQERLEKLQAESAERWATRKRRRRTRGWAGLPADPPGPPRFPSETTIDESKAFLSLDSALYRDIRARFQRICEQDGVIKKTIAGPERWEAVKTRLVQESPHLQTVFWNNNDNLEAKKLALDVVCTDVTKRMRTLERRMTIAEAKNALGVNPEQSRQIRNAFYQTLKADHFTSKLEAGDEHWKELKAQWIEGSDLLKQILAPGDQDPQHQEKIKAMEVLCRDVMKRLRDDQTKRDPTRKKKFDSKFTAATNPAQGLSQASLSPDQQPDFGDMSAASFAQHAQQVPAFKPQQLNNQYVNNHRQQDMSFQAGPHDALVQAAAHAQAQAHVQARSQPHNNVLASHEDLQIDPSLLLAAANDPSLIDAHSHSHQHPHSHTHHHFSEQQYADQQYAAQAAQAAFRPSPTSMAVYFRLHTASDIQPSATLWVATLTSVSVDELRTLAVAKFPGTIPVRIEGLVKQGHSASIGGEAALQIDQDDELHAYLQGIGGVKPVFVVQLMQGWKE